MEPIFSIIIPTFNNEVFLNPCINSILGTNALQTGYGELIIVNNGKQPIKPQTAHIKGITVLDQDRNLGWEGGLKRGLEYARGKFICFQNDDTFIPRTNYLIYEKLLIPFVDRSVAIVAPVTTTAAGIQSIYNPACPVMDVAVRWAIFFTVMVRREHLEAVGGIDDSLPGGDDIDLSIRMRNAGYKVLITPASFLIHHGFKTGVRVNGDHGVDGGWNSIQMTERTNQALIRKHGFKTFFETISSQLEPRPNLKDCLDSEGDMICSIAKTYDKVLEVGCGYTKTLPNTVGVDLTEKGHLAPIYHGLTRECVADVVADVTKPMPFDDNSFDCVVARHILEHCVDAIAAVKNWIRYLKPGGDIIIAVPNQEVCNGIPLSPDHVHAFTPDSLKTLMETLGLTQVFCSNSGNGISFIAKFVKPFEAFKKVILVPAEVDGVSAC